MTTNIPRLPKYVGPCTAKTDETWIDSLAFTDPDNNPIPLDGIAWELLVRKSAASKWNALYASLADYLKILQAHPTVAIQAPGSGYAIGEAVTLPGGLVVQVSGITGAGPTGPIGAVSIKAPGNFDAIPTNPVAQIATTGSGNAAGFTLTFVNNAIVIFVPKSVMQGLTAGDYAYTLRASADGIDADIVSGTLTLQQGTDD